MGTQDGLFDPYFGTEVFNEGDFILKHYCIGSESECDIVDATSVGELSMAPSAISIAPNPANGLVTVRLTEKKEIVEGITLYSLSGQMLRDWSGNGTDTLQVDTGSLPPGMYLLHVHSSIGVGFARLVVLK